MTEIPAEMILPEKPTMRSIKIRNVFVQAETKRHLKKREGEFERSREPFVVVDKIGADYTQQLQNINEDKFKGDRESFEDLIDTRRRLCQERLRLTKANSRSKPDQVFWENAEWRCEMALKFVRGETGNRKVFDEVTSEIATEMEKALKQKDPRIEVFHTRRDKFVTSASKFTLTA